MSENSRSQSLAAAMWTGKMKMDHSMALIVSVRPLSSAHGANYAVLGWLPLEDLLTFQALVFRLKLWQNKLRQTKASPCIDWAREALATPFVSEGRYLLLEHSRSRLLPAPCSLVRLQREERQNCDYHPGCREERTLAVC